MVKYRVILILSLLMLLAVPALAFTGITDAGVTVENVTDAGDASLWQSGVLQNYYDISAPFAFNSASGGRAISKFVTELDPGNAADYVIHLQDQSTLTGRADYQVSYLGFWENFNIEFNGYTHTYSGLAPFFKTESVYISYKVSDAGTTNQKYYISLSKGEPVLMHEIPGRPSDNPIVQVDVNPTGTLPRIYVFAHTTQELVDAELTAEGKVTDWIGWIKENTGTIWTAILTVWNIFNFFFIQNLLLTILLVEGAILAYSMNKSKDIFRAFAQVGKTNVYIARFIFEMIGSLIGYVTSIIQALKPI